MKVLVPSPLHGYTAGASEVEAHGDTIGALVDDLDRRFPGFKFRVIDEQDRVRTHVRFFVPTAGDEWEMVRDVACSIEGLAVVQIVCAISGG